MGIRKPKFKIILLGNKNTYEKSKPLGLLVLELSLTTI